MLTHRDLVNCLKASTPLVADDVAVKVKAMYPTFEPGKQYTVGDRINYTDVLYRCRQTHADQGIYTPDQMPALWTAIDMEHAGTVADPIPAIAGMEYTKGLYYIQDDVIYIMDRQGMAEGESIILAYLPSDLVGQYFTVVSNV